MTIDSNRQLRNAVRIVMKRLKAPGLSMIHLPTPIPFQVFGSLCRPDFGIIFISLSFLKNRESLGPERICLENNSKVKSGFANNSNRVRICL